MTEMLDHEVLDLLADDPELLALADAVAAARREPEPARRFPGRKLLATAAVLAAAVALAVVAPWNASHSTLVDRAIAAIGDGPVLHAITRETTPGGGLTTVDLATGGRTSAEVVLEQEIWYDPGHGLAHTISRQNGRLTDDVLQTPEGGFSSEGPVITCAWIARHPVEATKERVSCRFDGDNGTTPRDVPEPPPSVDPALAGFLTQYRDALASGGARKTGEGVVDGTPVYWLSIPIDVPTDPTAPPGPPIEERELVAVDRESYRPVLVKTLFNGSQASEYQVVEIGSVARDEANFSKPELRPARDRITSGEVESHAEIGPSEAGVPLGHPAFWLGREFGNLTLSSVERLKVTTGYARSTGLPPRLDDAIRFTYEDNQGHELRLAESLRPEFAFGWGFVTRALPEGPAPGKLVRGGFADFMVRDGVFIAIYSLDADQSPIAVARALVPVH
jgi:hypothetical protein